MSASQNRMSPQQLQAANLSIRRLVLDNSQDMLQSIGSGSIVPANQNTVNLPLRQVGLAKGFIIEITATFLNSGTGTATLTPLGPWNTISNFSFFDLDNYQRINTTGWHIGMLNSAKEGWPFGAALQSTATDTPIGFGNNTSIISATSSLVQNATGTIKMFYWVPLAYGKDDLRGAVFMGVVNATAYIQFSVNQTPGVTTGDNTLAVYSGANSAVTMTGLTYNIYQSYLDQLPRYQQGAQAGAPILPPLDNITQYRLVNTSLGAVSAGQDFPVPFSNFQEFLSLSMIYDQAGTRNPGTDINYFALAAANTLQFFKNDPYVQLLKQRVRVKTDFPAGLYMFDFRDQPISTNQSGNMQLLMNPITAAAGSQTLVGFESFALINTILGAQSLPAS
jgi:hypothetical protein